MFPCSFGLGGAKHAKTDVLGSWRHASCAPSLSNWRKMVWLRLHTCISGIRAPYIVMSYIYPPELDPQIPSRDQIGTYPRLGLT